MKKIFIAVLYLVSGQILAQTGESFFAQLPPVPNSTCMVDTTAKRIYKDQVGKVSIQLADLIREKKNKVQKDIDDLKPDIEKNIAKEYGLSDSDVQKLKNKKISKAEKKALMEKMLQENAQISMGEIEQLKKMKKDGNKEGIQNWADAYSTQKMAEMTTGDSTKTPEQVEMEKNLEKNSNLNDLVKEQKILVDRIHAVDKKYANQMIELNIEDSIQTEILNNNLEPLRKQLLNYPTKDQQKEIYTQMALYYYSYCEKMSPRYMNIIRELKIAMEPLLPDYNRLEILNAEINKITTDVKDWPTSLGLMQLEAVQGIANAMASVYRYEREIPDELRR